MAQIVEVYNIKWDTDGKRVKSLPKTFRIEVEDVEDEDALSAVISDHFGFCHFGFDYKIV